MSHAKFVHLHVHSAYSLSEGAIKLPQLNNLHVAASMPAVAVTDTGNLFGALEFSLAARRAGVQPIIGCQIAVARPTGIGAAHGHRAPGQRADLDDLVLLVRDRTG
ncbi:MAG: PHP domain-containing protein, partial [Proteobacteria bacterium]|nr:PHP domain-containing protein [Pseudomonadota bacterium]